MCLNFEDGEFVFFDDLRFRKLWVLLVFFVLGLIINGCLEKEFVFYFLSRNLDWLVGGNWVNYFGCLKVR